ncbi:MAG: Unknown protein [uncultured Sulfurovum sp.]|uniref:Uncharacterized protein n=1 Tax=uncultured Sulfurovum sp. TaxID=269237 RepID=A0A6S6TYF0_9BACT|nr:MAG: Unknown protein [uncultured Sulfurovum sp.]
MIIDVVSDVVKALNSDVLDNDKALHENVVDLMEETSFVWRKDYTIAVSKDDKKTKVANLMVCNKLDETAQTFKVKREKDYWKKLEARDDYQAVVECSLFARDTPLPVIETEGRDIMRSRKEVPTVAGLGFVWVVHLPPQENLDKLFQLYFKEDYITLSQDEAKYYIGWTENLKSLDMRNFICDPTAKPVENEIVDFSAEVEYDANTKD